MAEGGGIDFGLVEAACGGFVFCEGDALALEVEGKTFDVEAFEEEVDASCHFGVVVLEGDAEVGGVAVDDEVGEVDVFEGEIGGGGGVAAQGHLVALDMGKKIVGRACAGECFTPFFPSVEGVVAIHGHEGIGSIGNVWRDGDEEGVGVGRVVGFFELEVMVVKVERTDVLSIFFEHDGDGVVEQVPTDVGEVVGGDAHLVARIDGACVKAVGDGTDVLEGEVVLLDADGLGMVGGEDACGEHLQEVHAIFGAVGVVPCGLVGHHVGQVCPSVAFAVGVAEVDVEPVALVVAIDDEGVSAVFVVTRHKDGTALREFAFEHEGDFGERVEVAEVHLGVAVVAEVVDQCHGLVDGTCAAAFRSVAHVDGNAAVAAEQGDGLCLGGGVLTFGVLVEYVRPVVGVFGEVGRESLLASRAVGVFVGTRAVERPLPVVHDLSHGGGDAPHDASLACAVGGAQEVVGGILIPRVAEQGGNLGGKGLCFNVVAAVAADEPLGGEGLCEEQEEEEKEETLRGNRRAWNEREGGEEGLILGYTLFGRGC